MYAAAPLVAATCIAFWNSPATWPAATTGAFVIGMLVLLRLCVSLYDIPSSALARAASSGAARIEVHGKPADVQQRSSGAGTIQLL